MSANDQILDQALGALADEIKAYNLANGWYDSSRSFGEGIAPLHSEVSEAFEAYRDHGLADATLDPSNPVDAALLEGAPPKPEGVGSEFADVLIRLLDECERQGVDLVWETRRKLDYNKTRGWKHGGKRI